MYNDILAKSAVDLLVTRLIVFCKARLGDSVLFRQQHAGCKGARLVVCREQALDVDIAILSFIAVRILDIRLDRKSVV